MRPTVECVDEDLHAHLRSVVANRATAKRTLEDATDVVGEELVDPVGIQNPLSGGQAVLCAFEVIEPMRR